MDIAIVGATGNVGRKTLEVLEKKEFFIENLFLVASSNSLGKKITFRGREFQINNLENFDFSKVKIAFLLLEEKFQKNMQKEQQNIVW